MTSSAYDDDDYGTPVEAIESLKDTVADLNDRLRAMMEEQADASAGLRLDIGQSRREMVHVHSTLQRLQARFDNQLTILVLSNIASGVGVAALVLAASNRLS